MLEDEQSLVVKALEKLNGSMQAAGVGSVLSEIYTNVGPYWKLEVTKPPNRLIATFSPDVSVLGVQFSGDLEQVRGSLDQIVSDFRLGFWEIAYLPE